MNTGKFPLNLQQFLLLGEFLAQIRLRMLVVSTVYHVLNILPLGGGGANGCSVVFVTGR
jgi:hypothetical protein